MRKKNGESILGERERWLGGLELGGGSTHCTGTPVQVSLLVLQLEFSQLHNHAAINFGPTGIESCLLMHPKVICSKSSFYSVTNYL